MRLKLKCARVSYERVRTHSKFDTTVALNNLISFVIRKNFRCRPILFVTGCSCALSNASLLFKHGLLQMLLKGVLDEVVVDAIVVVVVVEVVAEVVVLVATIYVLALVETSLLVSSSSALSEVNVEPL